MHFLRQTTALLKKDFRREWRTRELTTTTFSFSLLLVLVASFAFFANETTAVHVFPGVLWLSISFTGNIAISRTFAMEKESGCLRVLAMVPGAWKSLYVAKVCVNLFFVALFETVLLPFLSIVFGVSLLDYGAAIWATTLSISVGFCAIGTLVSAMLVQNKLRDVMMPLLFYPLVIPLIIGGVKVTQSILNGGDVAHWFYLFIGVDVAALLISSLLFRWVLSSIE